MKILVRAPNWLGDLVMSAGFFNKLPELYPGSEIHVIVKEELADIVPLFDGNFHILKFSVKNYRGVFGIYRFAKKWLKGGYDMFFCLPGSFSSAYMGFCAGIKRRIGYRGQFRSILLTDALSKPAGLHRVEEYAFLLHNIFPAAASGLSMKINAPVYVPDRFGLPEKGIRIVLNACSAAPSRQLPQTKAAAIANAVLNETGCNMILTGSAREKEYINGLTDLINYPGRMVDLSGKTTLPDLAWVLKAADLVISADSGIAHFANSLGVHVIVIFGAGNEQNTAPYIKDNLRIIRATGVKCAPCVKNRCKYKSRECLKNIREEDVMHAIRQLLKFDKSAI